MDQPGHAPRERRDDLHPGRAVADHADTLAVNRNRMVPAGAVKPRAREIVQAGNVGDARVVKHTRRRDQDLRAVGFAGFGADMPLPVTPFAALDLGIEANVLLDSVGLGDILEVALDLRARRVERTPFRVEGEGIGIGVRGRVAGDSRIGVFAPGSADRCALFVDGEIRFAALLEADRGQQARHSRPDDDRAQAFAF